MGYNGPASGEPHCDDVCARLAGSGCRRSLHAEANALDSLPWGTQGDPVRPLLNLRMYCTDSPCMACCEKIRHHPHNILSVYYEREYRITTGLKYLTDGGIACYKVTQAGHVINWETGLMVDG